MDGSSYERRLASIILEVGTDGDILLTDKQTMTQTEQRSGQDNVHNEDKNNNVLTVLTKIKIRPSES